jgi:hypothetical protein
VERSATTGLAAAAAADSSVSAWSHTPTVQEGNGYTSSRIDSRKSGSWHPGMKVQQPACPASAVAGWQSRRLGCGYRVALHPDDPLPACNCPMLPACLQLPDGTELESLTIEARIQAPAPGKGLWGAF